MYVIYYLFWQYYHLSLLIFFQDLRCDPKFPTGFHIYSIRGGTSPPPTHATPLKSRRIIQRIGAPTNSGNNSLHGSASSHLPFDRLPSTLDVEQIEESLVVAYPCLRHAETLPRKYRL